jgi:hypothetical protein
VSSSTTGHDDQSRSRPTFTCRCPEQATWMRRTMRTAEQTDEKEWRENSLRPKAGENSLLRFCSASSASLRLCVIPGSGSGLRSAGWCAGPRPITEAPSRLCRSTKARARRATGTA